MFNSRILKIGHYVITIIKPTQNKYTDWNIQNIITMTLLLQIRSVCSDKSVQCSTQRII